MGQFQGSQRLLSGVVALALMCATVLGVPGTTSNAASPASVLLDGPDTLSRLTDSQPGVGRVKMAELTQSEIRSLVERLGAAGRSGTLTVEFFGGRTETFHAFSVWSSNGTNTHVPMLEWDGHGSQDSVLSFTVRRNSTTGILRLDGFYEGVDTVNVVPSCTARDVYGLVEYDSTELHFGEDGDVGMTATTTATTAATTPTSVSAPTTTMAAPSTTNNPSTTSSPTTVASPTTTTSVPTTAVQPSEAASVPENPLFGECVPDTLPVQPATPVAVDHLTFTG